MALSNRTVWAVKLLTVFAVAFSMASLAGPLSTPFPGIPQAHALPAPAEKWYPAGSAMDTQVVPITNSAQEYNCLLLSPPCIDLTDTPAPNSILPQISGSNGVYVTPNINQHGYYELEFNLANAFWGVGMGFGNDVNGVQLRQGFAHLIDKNSFTTNEPDITGHATPIDNPVPFNSSYASTILPTPNACSWDSLYSESGQQCTTSSTGGTAYNCNFSIACPTGTLGTAPPNVWQAQIGSANFCAAATHIKNALNGAVFVSSHGVTLNASCVLLAPGQSTPGTGWPTNVTSTSVNIFARSDDPPRLALGDSLAQDACAVFTGSYTTGCSGFVTVTPGPVTSFCGLFPPSPPTVSQCWQIYTGGFRDIFPFDQSIYYGYNSKFTIAPSFTGCISNPSSFNDYMYLCVPAYDVASSQMEFASTLSSGFTAATNAMNLFGQGAYTIPIWTGRDQFGYASNWSRVINGDGVGIPNFFTWLDAHTATPSSQCPLTGPVCIRQGFDGSTRSLNPYAASTTHDFYILHNIYDSLYAANPANNGQLIYWMLINSRTLTPSQLGYTPPPGTVATFRFTLRGDMFWHDNRKVTSWDVEFSLLSMNATGASQGAGLSILSGVRVLSGTQLDVHVKAIGPFTDFIFTGPAILPGRYWSGSCGGSTWDMDVAAGNVPDSCMVPDPSKTSPAFDPLASGILIGSGPWKCDNPATGAIGGGCSSSGTQNPPIGGSYTLTRYGIGHPPGSSVTDDYFRSNGALALWIWSGVNGDPVHDSLLFSQVAACFGKIVGTNNGCTKWQAGIGNPGGPVGGITVSIVLRFIFVNWVAPFTRGNPPQGMVNIWPPPGPILYEGTTTLNPSDVAGCGLPYPVGGYDC
jgi:hypothetical protein